MRKGLMLIIGVLAIMILLTAVSGCSGVQSLLPAPSSDTGPVHSAESSPISSTQGVDITRSGNTITAIGSSPYNTKSLQDPFLLKTGNATVTVELDGNGFGCSASLNYKRPGSQSYDFIPLYVMDDKRSMQVTRTVVLPYTGDYYLTVNWAFTWTITITQ